MGETQRMRENDTGRAREEQKTRQAKANIPSFVKPKEQFELAFEASSFIINH